MSKLATISPALEKRSVSEYTLEELFAEAESFGRIYLHHAADATFSFTIKFPTVANIELKAESGFGHAHKENAIFAAIQNAREIRKQFK